MPHAPTPTHPSLQPQTGFAGLLSSPTAFHPTLGDAQVDQDVCTALAAMDHVVPRDQVVLGPSPLGLPADAWIRPGTCRGKAAMLGVYTNITMPRRPDDSLRRGARTFVRSVEESAALLGLAHVNLMPFLGLSASWSPGSCLELVGIYARREAETTTLYSVLYGSCREELQLTSFSQSLSVCLGIASGLHYLHQQHIPHGDLSPFSVQLGPERAVKLAHFGLWDFAAYSVRPITARRYQAPEVLADPLGVSLASDVYSLGLLLFELASKQPCFQNVSTFDDLATLVVCQQARPEYPAGLHAGMKTLVANCWAHSPEDRYSTSRAVISIMSLLEDVMSEDSDDSDPETDAAFERRLCSHRASQV